MATVTTFFINSLRYYGYDRAVAVITVFSRMIWWNCDDTMKKYGGIGLHEVTNVL